MRFQALSDFISATGFIGYPVAQALARAGYIVLGQTRSESKAKTLAVEESMFFQILFWR